MLPTTKERSLESAEDAGVTQDIVVLGSWGLSSSPPLFSTEIGDKLISNKHGIFVCCLLFDLFSAKHV